MPADDLRRADWRAFQFFNLYRLLLAALSLVAASFPSAWSDPLHLSRVPALRGVALLYVGLIGLAMVAAWRWRRRFDLQLSVQVGLDVAVVAAFMYAGEGVAGGLGVLLLVSLAAASLVGEGRLILLYAAVATLAVLGTQAAGILWRAFDVASFLPAGLLCAGFFATAILIRLLARRVRNNEELARQHALALADQQYINQSVLERMQDGVLVVSRNGLILRFNPVAGELLKGCAQGLPLAACAPALAAMLEFPLRGERPLVHEFPADGGVRLRVRCEPTSSSAGDWLFFLEDLGRIEAEAQQLKLAALGRLTASIAHEIRNPLSAIGHAGELLREERRGELQERLITIIGDNVARLDRIVRQVLDLGRRDAALPETIPLADFCRDFAEHFRLAENVAADVLAVDVPVGLHIRFDPAQLHQVLWNLLANAVRHGRRQAGSVSLRAVAAGDGLVELHVRDDGPGVPAEAQAMIFEPFFTTQPRGTGLGLYLARELCAANGAHLFLDAGEAGGHFVIAATTGDGDAR